MLNYRAPIRDMRFVYTELLDGIELNKLDEFKAIDDELVDAVLTAAGKFCANVLLPTARPGDTEGCRFDNGAVRTPAGFRQAYQSLVEAGWHAMAMSSEYGGQGLPKSLYVLVDEMISAANLSLGLLPSLSNGAYNTMKRYATEAIKNTYFPPLCEGRWSGTMCLTEPHCGTDLGLLKTKAEPQADNSYLITGNKIFITWGEHDLSENIVHLVLARTPAAPPGIKGISLFVVPKYIVNEDGSLGDENNVSCGSIEHKMGIHGSPTCGLNFDQSHGYLIGELNQGLRAMFVMMNIERLMVGIQGLGISEIAYQGAVDYARERIQGRAPAGAKQPDREADPLLVHPDIRRMLLTMRAYSEGMRALGSWVGINVDYSEHHDDATVRAEAGDFVALMTPVVKALFTDLGTECANLGVQVFGGHGYISEHGMEQLVRDVRITQLYEGTNGVQAMDLIGRKLPLLNHFTQPVNRFISERRDNNKLAEFIEPLQAALERLQSTGDWLTDIAESEPHHAGAVAYDYLRLLGLTAMAYLWARAADVARQNLDAGEPNFYRAKIETARFFMQRLLPQTVALELSIKAGGDSVMALDDDAF